MENNWQPNDANNCAIIVNFTRLSPTMNRYNTSTGSTGGIIRTHEA
jgi:hypothetical protein